MKKNNLNQFYRPKVIVPHQVPRSSHLPKIQLPSFHIDFAKLPKNIITRLRTLSLGLSGLIFFFFIVVIFLIYRLLLKFPTKRLDFLKNRIKRILAFIDRDRTGSITRINLIELSFRNMQVKKTRTLVTMGGMAIGIAFIVFLVSIGYGLQNLVVSRVVRLDELKQADVLPGLTTELSLTEKTLTQLSEMTGVKEVSPVIAVVGQMSYKSSISDVAVYGVTTKYLQNSSIQPVKGRNFDNNDLTLSSQSSADPGVNWDLGHSGQTAIGDKIGSVRFQILPGEWVRVRESPSITADVIGYTRTNESAISGTEVYGDQYGNAPFPASASRSQNQGLFSPWIKAEVPLWKKTNCKPAKDSHCENGGYEPIDKQLGVGYLAELSMTVSKSIDLSEIKVLGDSTTSSTGSLPLVNIASESSQPSEASTIVVPITSTEKNREAVVNQATLRLLGVTDAQAINEKITLTFVVVSDLTPGSTDKIKSTPTEYTIVGVTSDTQTPVIYVPFIDLRSLGVTHFSQLKVRVDTTNNLSRVRKNIESSGYGTISVADTVVQINNLFSNLRLLLAVLGAVALSVASLGMFNTLTVSLLERTREVGLMKAMGMKSSEVRDLFLTESMIMGLFGGIAGLMIGFIVGKFVSILLSIFSVVKGVGFIDITFVPPLFVLAVLFLSIIVGTLTGLYPARRATKISALNALRYE